MPTECFTVIDEGRVCEVSAHVGHGCVRIAPDALPAVVGWVLKPQGLCKGDVCIPIRDRDALPDDDGIDLAAVAGLLSRPLALDLEERVAYLGASHGERAAQLASLQAPDFTLPDVRGKQHSLSDYRGKKILLVAYASW